jgi:hypothetical protein
MQNLTQEHSRRSNLIEDQLRHLGNYSPRANIYRRAHVHASGLFERRRATIRFALEAIIEQAANVRVAAESVVRAVHASACINKSGEWINPPVQIIHRAEQPSVAEPAASPDPASDGQSNPNRNIQELEHVSFH